MLNKQQPHHWHIEMRAGMATFLTAAYIIVVNPQILATTGMDRSALVTATCLATAFATLLLGLISKVPFMMAPGMGLNSFFAFSLCLSANIPWQTALGIVFISGALFLALSLIGFREKIIEAIPAELRHAITVGIGLFLVFIGLQNLGVVVKHEATLVTLGTFNAKVGMGLLGLLLAIVLMLRRRAGALLISMLSITALAFISGVTPIPDHIIAWPASLTPNLAKLDISAAFAWRYVPLILTFMFVNLFDSVGTLMALCERSQHLDKHGKIPRLSSMLAIDAVATLFGAILGTSTLTAYIESAAGVAEGGRGGLTAITIAMLFLLALFLTPLVIAIPAFAVAPALILVGMSMMSDISKIPLNDLSKSIPALLTLLLMPLSFSIANGILFGFSSYLIIQLIQGRWRQMHWMTALIGLLCIANLLFLHH